MENNDILKMTIEDLACPAIIALLNEADNEIEIIHTKHTAAIVGRMVEQMDQNKYRFKNTNIAWNAGKCKLLLLENLKGIIFPNQMESWRLMLYMRLKASEYLQGIKEQGVYKLKSAYKPISLTRHCDVITGYGLRLSFTTGRYKRYHVNKYFKDMEVLMAFLDVTPMDELILHHFSDRMLREKPT